MNTFIISDPFLKNFNEIYDGFDYYYLQNKNVISIKIKNFNFKIKIKKKKAA